MNYQTKNNMRIFQDLIETSYKLINENRKRINESIIFETINLTTATYKEAIAKIISIFNEVFLRENHDISDIAQFLKNNRSGNVTDYATFILKTIDINKKYDDSNIVNIFLNEKNSDFISEISKLIKKNNRKYIKTLTNIIEDILLYLNKFDIKYNEYMLNTMPISKSFVDINYGVFKYNNKDSVRNVFSKLKYIYISLSNQVIENIEEIENFIESVNYIKELLDNGNIELDNISEQEKDLLIDLFGDKFRLNNLYHFIDVLKKYFVPLLLKRMKKTNNKKLNITKIVKKLRRDDKYNIDAWIRYLMTFEFFIPFKIINKINKLSGTNIKENKKHIKITNIIQATDNIDMSQQDEILNIEDLLVSDSDERTENIHKKDDMFDDDEKTEKGK